MEVDDLSKQVDGTLAKDIALYFVVKCDIRATSSTYARTTNQAKSLLESGYTFDEIKAVIDYVVEVEKVDLYSLGYINSSITTLIKKAIKHRDAPLHRQVYEEQLKIVNREELKSDESSERNREKTRSIGTKSRFGEKFNFDITSKS